MKKACLLFALMITTSLFAQDYQGRLDDFFSSEIGKFKIPNVDISIVNDSEIFYSKSYGEKRSHNSLHYIGSVSKSLTAIGVLKLIEGKKLDFKQKLSDIIPNIKYNEYSRNITIRNLLNHTSGISKRSGFSNLPSLPELNTTNYSLEVKREPGKVYEYSNLNYSLLGLVIEQISGVPFSDFMLANIFKPLNMNSSKIFLHRQENDEIIKQYQYWGNFPIRSKQVNYETTSIPAGFILSNAEDLSKYLAMMLTNVGDKPKRFLEPRLISEMLTPWDNSEFGYGMGWKKGAYNGKTMYQHLGSTATSYSAIFIIPEKNIGFVILTNSNSLIFTEQLTEGILNILTDGKIGPVSSSEFYLRIGVLIAIIFFSINLLIKLTKVLRHKKSVEIKKTYLSIFINILVIILFIFAFPYLTNVPFLTFLKLQPDIGTLTLIIFISPIVLNTFKVINYYNITKKYESTSR